MHRENAIKDKIVIFHMMEPKENQILPSVVKEVKNIIV
jgi:hypothetical protein